MTFLNESPETIVWSSQENVKSRPHRGLGQLPPAEYAALFPPEDERFSTPALRC